MGAASLWAASRAVEAAVDSCREDVPELAHWWSNCLHLRWMLWAMCRGDEGGGGLDEFDLVMQACRLHLLPTPPPP